MVEIVYNSVLQHISSQLHMYWCLVGSLKHDGSKLAIVGILITWKSANTTNWGFSFGRASYETFTRTPLVPVFWSMVALPSPIRDMFSPTIQTIQGPRAMKCELTEACGLIPPDQGLEAPTSPTQSLTDLRWHSNVGHFMTAYVLPSMGQPLF